MSLISTGSGISQAGSSFVTVGDASIFMEEMGPTVSPVLDAIPDPDPPAPDTEISFIFCTG